METARRRESGRAAGGAYPGAVDREWNRTELREILYELLYRVEPGPTRLNAELERLERRHGATIFSELIFLLCHLRFEPEEAKRCWEEVLAHREELERRLGSPVDLRVALASYFLQVNRQLENPKIIELKLFEQTQASAYRDELTGLHNYRFFAEFLRYEIPRAERTSTPLSLVMLDVDDFKHYNDSNGHEIGNVALRKIARLLEASLEEADIAARYGGEEFALILPSTGKPDARLVAERIRAAIEAHGFANQATQPGGTLTVSAGVATFPADARDSRELVHSADRAMYAAKADGKNLVQLFGDSCRSYDRVDAHVEGAFQQVGHESIPLTCIKLSERGLRFLTTHHPAPNTLIDVTLRLPGCDDPLRLTSRVVHVMPTDSGQYAVGSRILDIGTADLHRLADYLSQRAVSAA